MRSKLETRVFTSIKKLDKTAKYEPDRISYLPKTKHYTPDIKLKNGIYIEVKGRFTSFDRSKHLRIKEQHPEIDIRFVFQTAKQKLNKKSKTTYGQWATKKGYKWCEESDIETIKQWIKE